MRISSSASVDDPARETRVELLTEDALGLSLLDDALDHGEPLADVVDLAREVRAPPHLAHHDGHEVRVVAPGAEEDLDDPEELLVGGLVGGLDLLEPGEELAPVLAEDRLEHLVLRREVVVQEAVRDSRLLRDVADPRRVEASSGEHPHGRVEDLAPLLLGASLTVCRPAPSCD